ncbi:MAG: DUF2157 domain-containing protein [Pseudomonadota bacterium]|nr:DUF2157 domain-containing protein [Pseudomonadota bacterium]
MDVTKRQLKAAANEGIISAEQSEALYEFLSYQSQSTPTFNFTHTLYYLGGMMAIGAMSLFMNLGWESFGGAGIFFISLLYAVLGLWICHVFAARNLSIPAGICATFVVCITPLAVYGLQKWLGVWPDESLYKSFHRTIKWHWIYMEVATLVVGGLLAWKYKYPFMVMPIAVTLWYMSMDVVLMLAGDRSAYELRALISMYVGLIMIILAFVVDLKAHKIADYAFWLYLFGVLTFWGGMSSQHSDDELSKFIYFSINLVMVGIGVLLMRRVFVVFGALGCCAYFGHLASSVFKDSWLFPMALVLIGLGIIALGVIWQKNEQNISMAARKKMPLPLRELLEFRES